jgi:hypothetical protein
MGIVGEKRDWKMGTLVLENLSFGESALDL